MIQRKQTIYLFLVAMLMVVCGYYMFADSDKMYYIILAALSAVIAFASFLTIFCYNKRRRQMSYCRIGMIATLVWCAAFFYVHYVYSGAHSRIPLYALLPIVCIILFGMAYKGIKKDDDLVRSADRIR